MTALSSTVLLIDDDPAVGAAMERWLRDTPSIMWLGCAQTFEQGLSACRSFKPRLVLLDLDLALDRLDERVAALIDASPHARVVMFTGHADPALIDEALDAGAAGHINKDTELSTMLDLFFKAAAGEIVLCPTSLELCRRRPAQ